MSSVIYDGHDRREQPGVMKKHLGNILQALIIVAIVGVFNKLSDVDDAMTTMAVQIKGVEGKSELFLVRQVGLLADSKENTRSISDIKQNTVSRQELKETVRGVKVGIDRLSDKVDKIRQ